jgi:hypothetical protein
MEHKGIRYEVVQTLQPRGWKWIVHLDSTRTQTGFASDKQLAIHAATRAIDKALAAGHLVRAIVIRLDPVIRTENQGR